MFNNAWYKAEEFWCLFVFCNLPNFSACPQSVFFFHKMTLKVQISVQHVNHLNPRS